VIPLENKENKVEIMEEDERKIKLKMNGYGHTFCNLLQKVALKHPHVTYASYNIGHPLVQKPVFTLITDGSVSPREVLKELVERIIEDTDSFLEKFKNAVRGG